MLTRYRRRTPPHAPVSSEILDISDCDQWLKIAYRRLSETTNLSAVPRVRTHDQLSVGMPPGDAKRDGRRPEAGRWLVAERWLVLPSAAAIGSPLLSDSSETGRLALSASPVTAKMLNVPSP